MSIPIDIPRHSTSASTGGTTNGARASASSTRSSTSSASTKYSSRKVIRCVSPSYININSIKGAAGASGASGASVGTSYGTSYGTGTIAGTIAGHPLGEDSDSESVFDDSFENSSISSSNSSINSSFLRSASPLHINLKSKCQVSVSPTSPGAVGSGAVGSGSVGSGSVGSGSSFGSAGASRGSSPGASSPKGMAFEKLSYFKLKPARPSFFRTSTSASASAGGAGAGARSATGARSTGAKSSSTGTKSSATGASGLVQSRPSASTGPGPGPLLDLLPIELQTFKLDNPIIHLDTIKLTKSFKHRDERINSSFLKLYSLDYSSRMANVLPNSNSDIIPIDQLKFHQKHNLYKLSLSSRDKLWENIILPPRVDECPKASVDHKDYIYVGYEHKNSLTMKNGDILPWTSSSKSLKPSGVLKGKRCLANGPNPNSGVTNCQYTIKGWCNSRWTDSSEN